MRFPHLLAAAAAALCSTLPASAHDFWIRPTTWAPAPGDLVGLHLAVGHAGEVELLPRQESRLVRFVARPPAEGEEGAEATDELPAPVPVVGADGRAPAGYLRVERTGLHVLGYESDAKAIELEAARFDGYLREEGLEHIVEERTQRGERELPGKEAYSRAAKCLLRADGGPTHGFDRALGLPLELVPQGDPFALEPGAALRMRVLWKGEPLAGLFVDGQRLDGEGHALVQARSDEEGLLRFALPEGETWNGAWLFAGVHMLRAPEEADEDWRSVWASLTFELAAH